MPEVYVEKGLTIQLAPYNSIKFGYAVKVNSEKDLEEAKKLKEKVSKEIDKWIDEHEVDIRRRINELESQSK